MVWSVETDDFHGTYGTPFILIKTIYETLNGPIVYPTPPTAGTSTTTTAGTGPTPDSTTSASTVHAYIQSNFLVYLFDLLVVTQTRHTTVATPPPSTVCEKEGYHPDPTDCNKYYLCVPNGDQWIVYYYNCGAGTVFDPTTNNCNFPYNVPGCEDGIPGIRKHI